MLDAALALQEAVTQFQAAYAPYLNIEITAVDVIDKTRNPAATVKTAAAKDAPGATPPATTGTTGTAGSAASLESASSVKLTGSPAGGNLAEHVVTRSASLRRERRGAVGWRGGR